MFKNVNNLILLTKHVKRSKIKVRGYSFCCTKER